MVFLGSAGIAQAFGFSFSRQFAGNILNSTKSKEIEALEAAGYKCNVPGKTIEIIPKGMRRQQATSYFIPAAVKPVSKYPLKTGQQTIGKITGKTVIVCIYQSVPPLFEFVTLDTVTLFTTSRR